MRRIGRLYAPVALGIGFSLIGTVIDRRLASSATVGEEAIAYMSNATTLIQFTLGLIAAAISLAILPTLSRLSTSNDEAGFSRILGLGLKTVILLIVPAMVVLAILGGPVIRLLLQGGEFTAENTRVTTLVLLAYLPSLLAAAVDQPLIFAFYARKRTLLPNLVQGVAVAAYCAVAFGTYQRWGMYGLIAANVMQWVVHAAVMVWLTQRQLNVLAGQNWLATGAKIGLAAGAMALVCAGVAALLPPGDGYLGALLTLLVAGGLGTLAYVGLLWQLRLDALRFFGEAVLRKLRRG